MSERISDRSFVIYRGNGSYLGGEIINGMLRLDSEVYGDDYESEQHMEFSVENTARLFELMPFESFETFVKEQHLLGLNDFLRKNGIVPKTITI